MATLLEQGCGFSAHEHDLLVLAYQGRSCRGFYLCQLLTLALEVQRGELSGGLRREASAACLPELGVGQERQRRNGCLIERWPQPSFHSDLQRLRLAHKPAAVRAHQCVESRTLGLRQRPFALTLKEFAERGLIRLGHLKGAEQQDLLVGEKLDVWLTAHAHGCIP